MFMLTFCIVRVNEYETFAFAQVVTAALTL